MKRLILIAMVVLLSASIALAQDFCKGDFNYNGSVAAEDVSTFLEHFGRSPFFNPCPPDGPAAIPKTGCDYSTALADDGEKQCGASVAVRFTDNSDGTVRDNLTGLIWLKNWIGTRVTWVEAVDGCSNLSNGEQGLSDYSDNGEWRLPNINEWLSLADFGCSGYGGTPCLTEPHPFDLGNPSYVATYWTSTNTLTSLYSYTFSFDNGTPESFIKAYHQQLSTYYYACVKCGCRGSPESGHTMYSPCCNSSECQAEPGCCCRYFSNGQWYRECMTPNYCFTQVDSGSCVNPDVIYW